MRAGIAFACIVIFGCGSDERGGVDAPPGDGPTADSPSGGACGGFAGGQCATDQYCDYPRNTCGQGDEPGVCRPKPTGCPDPIFEATCACDLRVYGQPCEAYMAGFDLNQFGGCPVPTDSFECGFEQCNRRTEYCQHVVSDVGSEPDEFQCMPIPACPTMPASCACLASEPCGSMCSGNAQVGLTLTCPGG